MGRKHNLYKVALSQWLIHIQMISLSSTTFTEVSYEPGPVLNIFHTLSNGIFMTILRERYDYYLNREKKIVSEGSSLFVQGHKAASKC